MAKPQKKNATKKAHPPVDPAQLQTTIGLKLEVNQKERLRLAAQWNSLSVTARLPDELLLQIFKILIETQCHWEKPTGFYGWLVITAVCHRWRQVALRTPALWQSIKLILSPIVKLFLARSQSMLLDIEGPVTYRAIHYDEGAQLIRRVIKSSSRIRRLKLVFATNVYGLDPAAIQRGIDRPDFRQLKTLIIHTEGGHSASLPGLVSPTPVLPLLENLRTSNIAFSAVRDLLVPSLRTLTLSEAFDIRDQEPPGWPSFANAFSGLRSLHSLDLNAFPRPAWNPCPSADLKVALPALRCLTIELPFTALPAATFLTYIDASITKFKLRTGTLIQRDEGVPFSYHCRPSDMVGIVSAVQASVQEARMPHIQAVRLFVGQHRSTTNDLVHYMTVDCWTQEHPLLAPRDDRILSVHLDGYSPQSILTEVVPILPLKHVKYLDVFHPSDEGEELRSIDAAWFDWYGVCFLMPKVEQLEISTLSTQGLLRCLAMFSRDSDDSSLFRKLHTIIVWGVDFAFEDPVNMLSALLEVLKARSEGKLRVRKLTIRAAKNLTEQGAESLSTFVDEIDWDGVAEVGEDGEVSETWSVQDPLVERDDEFDIYL